MAIPSNDPTSGERFVDAGSAQSSRDAARQAVDRISNTAGEAVDRLSSTAAETVDRVSGRARQTVERVADSASDYATRGGQRVDDAREWIAASPWRAIAIAAAAGFVIVRMMS